MKALLAHPSDAIVPWAGHWDLVIDCARAPRSCYQEWSTKLGCEVLSRFQLAQDVQDLYAIRGLLQLGHGLVVDDLGIDWWEILGAMLQPQLQEMMLLQRLCRRLQGCSQLAATRRFPLAETLAQGLGIRPTYLQAKTDSRWQRMRRAASNLSPGQMWLVALDTYDPVYAWRRKFAQAPAPSTAPRVLLPSAYRNASNTELEFARLLPEQQFLLVAARPHAFVSQAPANVTQVSLAGYATSPREYRRDLNALREKWDALGQRLAGREEFQFGFELGVFARGRSLLPWGVALREAWRRVLETENIVGCLSADDSNPASRIPLALAHGRGIAAAACHHGALDYAMAFKQRPYDAYFARREMEMDYLTRVCEVPDEVVRVGVLQEPKAIRVSGGSRPWIAFFTEPYEVEQWRIGEIYKEVLPALVQTAKEAGRVVALKLHPFENAKQRLRLVDSILTGRDRKLVEVVDEPLSDSMMEKIWRAVTVESTTAVQCAEAGIPAFLLGWLRHSYTGYAEQYERFGVARILRSAAEIPQILDLPEESTVKVGRERRLLPSDLEGWLNSRPAAGVA